MEALAPPALIQERIMSTIRTIKTGQYNEEVFTALREAINSLTEAGAEIILVACTELSVVSGRLEASVPILDAAQILAEHIVREAQQTI